MNDDFVPSKEVVREIIKEQRSQQYAYGWNGIRADGTPLSVDPYRFVAFAMMMHPGKYLNEETGELLTLKIILTKEDAEAANDLSLEGAVLVTINPPTVTSYQASALQAEFECRSAGDKANGDRFQALHESFKKANFD